MRSSNEEIYLSMGISKTVYDYGCTIEKSLETALMKWIVTRNTIS